MTLLQCDHIQTRRIAECATSEWVTRRMAVVFWWYILCVTKKGMKPNKANPTTAQPSESVTSNHDEIARRAYLLYEQNGRQEGRDMEYWLEAEKSLVASKLVEPLTPMEFAEAHERHGGNGHHSLEAQRKNSATREEIRQITSHVRNAPRQSQRPHEQSA